MAATGNGWHTVLHVEGHNEAGEQIMSTQKRRHIDGEDTDKSFRGIEFNINEDTTHDTPRQLARIGTNPSCDIVLPVEFMWFKCYFDVNRISGEILLHVSFDGAKDRQKKVDFRLKRWDVGEDEYKYHRVHLKTTDWAIVLHPDLSPPQSSEETTTERQYVLTVGRAEFLIRPPGYGPGTYGPAPEILRYMKSHFGTWHRPHHHDSVYKGKITNVPIRKLGEGGQGVVNHVVSTLNGCHFARKVINVSNIPNYRICRDGRSFVQILLAEVKLLEKLHESKAKHIVQYLHTEGLDEKNTVLKSNVVVYMNVYEGSLLDMIAGGKFRNLSEGMPLLMTMVQHMATALSALSDVNAIHRDIKPENILYDGSSFHLTDFGLAKAMDDYATFVGTDLYRAPEVTDMVPHTPKVDIFSLGVTIAACLKSMSREEMIDAFRENKAHWPVYVQGILSEFGGSLFARMVRQSPNDRPTAEQVLSAANTFFSPDLVSLSSALEHMAVSASHAMGRGGGWALEHSPNGPMAEPFPPW